MNATDPRPTLHAPGSRSGLGVVSVVLAATALLGVFGIIVWLALTGGPQADDGGGTVTGQVAVRGGGLSGDDLAAALRQRIRDDGGSVSRMSCPATASVRQNVTTVCHGIIDDDDWAMVVFFEDTSGNYTLLPL